MQAPMAMLLLVATLLIAPSAEVRTGSPNVGTVQLKSVSYSGPKYRAVRQDDNTASYDAPHWQDNSTPLDGDARDSGDRRFPVSYTRESRISVSATWVVDPPVNFQNAKVRGSGPDGIQIPATTANLAGNILSITNVVTSQDLPANVRFYNLFTIDWQVMLQGNWVPAGRSENRMFVTFADPLTGAIPFESVLEIGTRNADGKSDGSQVIDAVWSDFANPIPGVKRKAMDGHNQTDDKELTYWKPIENRCTTLEEMLKSATGNGTCDAWARLFHQALLNLGVSQSRVVQVISTYRNDAGHVDMEGVPATEHRGVMLVRKWILGNPPNAHAMCQPFTHQINLLQDQEGEPGQGNTNPPASFVEHFIVRVGPRFYDPSYGQGPFANESEWENASLSHFGKVCVIAGQQGKVFKTNDPNLVETRFAFSP